MIHAMRAHHEQKGKAQENTPIAITIIIKEERQNNNTRHHEQEVKTQENKQRAIIK